ncbi:MAG: aldehyde dehydrogenase family protein, partial [Planctomycetes bacterium]|nr:aldehyde dehydrogenase family protein [Planctomycetota bacterium]
MSRAMHKSVQTALESLGVKLPLAGFTIGDQSLAGKGDSIAVHSPIDGKMLAELTAVDESQFDEAVEAASEAFRSWRVVPAPVRGEFVRQFGQRLRAHKESLATLVTWEAGKIYQESLGEVQEMIDICDFAVGLSRQLYGNTMASERPGHRLAEQWHPLGPVGVISAFNFPVAVWAWNATIAWVCGNPVIWKPSEKTPLTAIACQALFAQTLADSNEVPPGISSLVVGKADIGQKLASSPALPLVSATGSVPMGRAVAQTVAARLGRSLLELGGNNGMVVAPTADLELAVRSITFSAVGTCGQRCTSLRRLIVHQSIADQLRDRLLEVFAKLPIGDPNEKRTLVGPLIDQRAVQAMSAALADAKKQGGIVHGGERVTDGVPTGGVYVRPALVEIAADAPILQQETFAPI